VSEGLAHRIESRNAYIACGRDHGDDDVIVFLICEQCGLTSEVSSHAIGRDLAWATRAAGFTPHTPVIEIAGTCARCKAAALAAVEAADAGAR
jgi:Fur family zinc uptake transcriptional regulator